MCSILLYLKIVNMCDLRTVNRKSCYGLDGKRLKPVKISKWELPLPSARSYWEGVIADVEKKCVKVRHPYPFSFPSPISPISLSKPLLPPDDIKFKISPPTPLHKPYKSLTSDSSSLSAFDKQKDTAVKINKDFETALKLPAPSISTKIKSKSVENKKPPGSIEVKIYPANSCPLHKREKPCKIFDDNISEYLRRPASSVPKLPSVAGPRKLCEHHRLASRTSSASSARLRSIEKAASEELRERKFTKPPKLGMASLLPSFAKQVSTDSSVGTRESLELEEEAADVKAQPALTDPLKRSFLRVPNLSFVSSHPSFRKLSLVDSCDKDDRDELIDMPVIVEERSSADEVIHLPRKKTLTFKDELVEEKQLTLDSEDESSQIEEKVENVQEIVVTKPYLFKKPRPKTVSDLSKKYSYKALDFCTKHKHRKDFKFGQEATGLKASLSSEDSYLEYETKRQKRGRSALQRDQLTSTDLRDIQKNLRETAKKYLDLDLIPRSLSSKSDKSTTIRTSSRSTSGPSPANKSIDVLAPSVEILKKIPQTRLHERPKIDKCHSCIQKPLTAEKPSVTKPKIKRELLLTSLMSVVNNPPNFNVSSSSSSSSLEDLFDLGATIDDETDRRYDLERLETLGFEDDERKLTSLGSKSVSFDEINIAETLSGDQQSPLGSKSPPPKLVDQGSKDSGRLSVQSSDRSKTSTPTKSQSSDSEGMVESSLPTSKHTAAYHKPLVWAHNLAHLQALKLKKATSLRARTAALLQESSEESEDPDAEAKKKAEEEEERKKRKARKKRKKKIKELTRIKTAEDIPVGKEKPALRRVKTTYDLPSLTDASGSDEDDSSDESSAEEAPPKPPPQEPLPLAEEVRKHCGPSPAPPTLSQEDILRVVQECIEKDVSPSELWEKLSTEFVEKLEKKCELYTKYEEVKYLKQGLRLFKALVESRRYLRPELFDPNLKLSQTQPPVSNTRQVRRILPYKTFDLAAPILGMPLYYKEEEKRMNVSVQINTSESSEDSDASDGSTFNSNLSTDMIVHPRTPEYAGSYEEDGKYVDPSLRNPYALFLKKSRRKAVVWRPLTEEDMKGYDPEATLELRAARLLDRISKEFCAWLQNLGGSVIDEETLKDMFEINFSSEACKTMVVIQNEMPTVPTAVAQVRRCPEASKLAMTQKEIAKDLEVEKRERRTHAFGRALPADNTFVPPLRKLCELWTRNERIPKDLESMDIVWDGIMHLDSVKSFMEFLRQSHKASHQKLLTNLMSREDPLLKSKAVFPRKVSFRAKKRKVPSKHYSIHSIG